MKLRYKLPGGRKRLLRDWIAALRSGEYKQCRNMYESGYKTFCAIGLLGYIACAGPLEVSNFLKVRRSEVVSWNDDFEYNFREIADILEIHYG